MSFKDKYRSTSKQLRDKVLAFSLPFESGLITNDYWIMLFIGCFSLFVPKLLLVIPIYVLLKTNRKVVLHQIKQIKQRPRDLERMVLLIQMNRLKTLAEAIETNPVLLHAEYKKKTLLSWCEHYNNTRAHMVVIQMTKKYPKESENFVNAA